MTTTTKKGQPSILFQLFFLHTPLDFFFFSLNTHWVFHPFLYDTRRAVYTLIHLHKHSYTFGGMINVVCQYKTLSLFFFVPGFNALSIAISFDRCSASFFTCIDFYPRFLSRSLSLNIESLFALIHLHGSFFFNKFLFSFGKCLVILSQFCLLCIHNRILIYSIYQWL